MRAREGNVEEEEADEDNGGLSSLGGGKIGRGLRK
jgi:hypothetical protein